MKSQGVLDALIGEETPVGRDPNERVRSMWGRQMFLFVGTELQVKEFVKVTVIVTGNMVSHGIMTDVGTLNVNSAPEHHVTALIHLPLMQHQTSTVKDIEAQTPKWMVKLLKTNRIGMNTPSHYLAFCNVADLVHTIPAGKHLAG